MKRKYTAALAAIICTAMAGTPAPFAHAQSKELAVGTIVDSVLTTDIHAFVNGEAIRSMNIGGNTAIVVEDLRSYGFDVSWDPSERQVDIYPNPAKKVQSTYVPNGYGNMAVGNKIADVLTTNIHTVALGKEIPSFNIGGHTAVFLQDLAPLLGSLEWNEKTRTASFTENKSVLPDPRAEQSAAYPLQIEHLSNNGFSILFTDDGMYFGDKRVGFGQDGRAMLSVEWMAEMLGYKTEKHPDGLYVHNDTCGFLIGTDLETAELYWFDGKDDETKLTFPAVERDGELYAAEYDLKELFGYTGNWNSDKRELHVEHARFEVKDFGIPEHKNSYWYAVKGLLFAPLTMDMPMLTVTASRGGKTFGGSSSMALSEQKTASGAPIYEFSSEAPLDLGDNEVKVELRVHKRIVFSKTFVHTLKSELLNPVINYGDLGLGFGDFSSITLETPASGQVRSKDGKFDVKGTVTKSLGTGLHAMIEKEDDGGNWSDRETAEIPFDAGHFAVTLPLDHGKGRYRVTLRSDLSIPAPRQYDPYIDVARFYVEYRDGVPLIVGLQGNEGFSWRDGKLLHTSNTGKTWDVVVPDGIGVKDRPISADFNDPFTGFAFFLRDDKKLAATHRLQDGGGQPAGWETAVLPTTEAWETSPDVTPHSALLYYSTNYVMLTSSPAAGQMNKSLYRLDYRGKSWTRVGDITTAIGGYPTGISFRKEKEGWIAASNRGQDFIPLYRTQDGGRTWTVQHVDAPADLQKAYANTYPPVFDQENDHHGLFIAEFVQDGEKTYVPYETNDAGDTWIPLPNRLKDIQGVPVLHFDGLVMGRAISNDGKTIYTMDTYNHEDWQPIKTDIPLQDASQFFLRTDGFGWVLLDGSLKVTNDGGITWSDPS
ncbi:hypothetical protein [Paenibacillus planticolens]|uniref:BNR/Asp-box repeat protein n=1 Tax=Paenibacillus planticolens TaxID=2654976 RepID=A0ABX1ZHK7_9BACL|nr:hypothetical protein [Paenibacillus planticolens]NOU98534.1 hypothetical protein [Paenibacillus planticolens]